MEEEIVPDWDAHALSKEVGPGPALAHGALSGSSNNSVHWPLGSTMIVTDHDTVGSVLQPMSTQRKRLLWQVHPSAPTVPNNGPLPL